MNTGNFRGFEVRIEDPGIVIITFNEPDRLNGMTMPMKRDLIEIITQAQIEEDVRVVVFTGSGRAFSAGDDISGNKAGHLDEPGLVPDTPPAFGSAKNHQLGTYNGLRTYSQALNLGIRNLDKITIAAINGVTIQTGLSLALCCDFRIASTEARLGSGTLRFALLPDEGGQFLLLQHMGLAKTLEFLMRNKIVMADEAKELGLVNEVVEPDDLMDATMTLAREFANGPQVAMRLLKRSIYNASELTFPQALDEIASKTALSDPLPDAKEGVTAWKEKRTPVFNKWLE